MTRDHAAGAIVLEKLRERIVSGCYLGKWRPGHRLPSIRAIAMAEGVDRKTAAAAYRSLQEEGWVDVHSRSGVYLRRATQPKAASPLDRLHRQWLTHTYEGARALGLDTGGMVRLIGSVAETERLRLPVIECDWAQAESIAAEIRERLQLRASPFLLGEFDATDPILADAPAFVTTPYHASELALLAAGQHVVHVTLAPQVTSELFRRLRMGRVVLVTGTAIQMEKCRSALEQHSPQYRKQLSFVVAEDREQLLAAVGDARTVFLWPGAPDWAEEALPPRLERYRPTASIATESLAQIQLAILHAALKRLRESAAVETVRT
jgi:DNA-binding transcriptional regulator YhcF (GntR family)